MLHLLFSVSAPLCYAALAVVCIFCTCAMFISVLCCFCYCLHQHNVCFVPFCAMLIWLLSESALFVLCYFSCFCICNIRAMLLWLLSVSAPFVLYCFCYYLYLHNLCYAASVVECTLWSCAMRFGSCLYLLNSVYVALAVECMYSIRAMLLNLWLYLLHCAMPIWLLSVSALFAALARVSCYAVRFSCLVYLLHMWKRSFSCHMRLLHSCYDASAVVCICCFCAVLLQLSCVSASVVLSYFSCCLYLPHMW